MMRETVTLYVPNGYVDAEEFLRDCQFERVDPTGVAQSVVTLSEIDVAIAAFGRSVTETAIQRPLRIEAEANVRDFLQTLRGRLLAAQPPAAPVETDEAFGILKSGLEKISTDAFDYESRAYAADVLRRAAMPSAKTGDAKKRHELAQRLVYVANSMTETMSQGFDSKLFVDPEMRDDLLAAAGLVAAYKRGDASPPNSSAETSGQEG